MRVKKHGFVTLLALLILVSNLQSLPTVNAQSQVTEIQAVAWSPDGSQIAMGGYTTPNNSSPETPILTIRTAIDISTIVLDLATVPGGQTRQILSVAWSPDDKYLVSGSGDGTVAAWAINDSQYPAGQLLARLGNYDTPINNVTWSPNGKWIASVAADKQISIWNATNNDYRLIDSTPTTEAGYTAWSPNSTWLAKSSSNGAVMYAISSTGHFLPTSQYRIIPPQGGRGIPGIAWNSCGSQLALASYFDNKIYIYDFNTTPPTLSRTVNLSSTPGILSWSPDGTLFAFSGSNKTARVVSAITGAELASYATGKLGAVENLAWKPDGSQLAFSSAGDTAQVVTAPDSEVQTPVPTPSAQS